MNVNHTQMKNIENKIKEYILSQLNCVFPDDNETKLKEYGITSLKYILLISYIEQEFQVTFSDNDFFESSLDTISDLTNFIYEKTV